MDEVDVALEMGQGRIAQVLVDRLLKAAGPEPTDERLTVLRRRAAIAEELSIDDDDEELAATAKRIGEAALHPAAGPEDRAAWAWALLMANAPRKARRVESADPLVDAGLAWVAKPTPERRAAMVGAAGPRLDRVVRLFLQRSEPATVEAERCFEQRRALAPLPNRHTLRALRQLVEALRGDRDPRADELAALDPDRSTDAAEALRRSLQRLREVEARFGDPALAEPGLWSLARDARLAREHGTAAEALERIDALLARRRGNKSLQDRRHALHDLRKARVALGQLAEASEVITREEAVLSKMGLPTPYHMARAEVALAGGDHDACVEEHRRELARCEAGEPPAYGPDGWTTKLVLGWTRMAERGREDASVRASPKDGPEKASSG